jgi:hypothetical protein
LKSKDGFDKYAILLRPVATEKAMKKMEEENTMVIKRIKIIEGIFNCIECIKGLNQRSF